VKTEREKEKEQSCYATSQCMQINMKTVDKSKWEFNLIKKSAMTENATRRSDSDRERERVRKR